MDYIIQNPKTPDECIQLAKNVRERNPELAQKARRRAVELRAISYKPTSKVELELLKALYAYEEVLTEKNKRKTSDSRTWQMIKRHGLIHAAERAVDRKIEPAGYRLLVEMGMQDLTFEAVIVRYPESFSSDVVSRAKERLREISELKPEIKQEPETVGNCQTNDQQSLVINLQAKPDVEYLTSERMKGLPFSEAVRVGTMLYLSGQIGVDSSMKLVSGGIAPETRQTMENMKAALERYGSSLDHVIKVTAMLADMSEWAEMNKVYVDYFAKHLPARSSLGANGLALGARVEIECIAILK